MSILILVILSFAASVMILTNRRRLALATTATMLLITFFVGTGLAPKILLSNLQTTTRPQSVAWRTNNVIILLGAGTAHWPNEDHVDSGLHTHSRFVAAVKLYFSCKKQSASCHILLSGGDPSNNKITEAEVMARDLLSINVDKNDLILESKSLNTFQNAKFSSAIVKEKNFDQVVLLTSGFHLRRAMADFNFFNVAVTPVPADFLTPVMSFYPLGVNFYAMDIALHEYIGIVQFYFYNSLGLNG